MYGNEGNRTNVYVGCGITKIAMRERMGGKAEINPCANEL
jgi:hypothetical protein